MSPPGYDIPHTYDDPLVPPGYDHTHIPGDPLVPPGYDSPHVYDGLGGGSDEAASELFGHLAEEAAPAADNRRDRIRAQIQDRIVKTPNQDAQGQDLSWVTDDSAPLHGRAKGEKYGGAFPEDQVLGFRAPAHRPELRGVDYGVTTRYANDAQREEMRARQGDDGRLSNADDDPLHGERGWVMSPQTGAMHTFQDVAHIVDPVTGDNIRETKDIYGDAKAGHKVKTSHHSTALAGAPVAGAGFAQFDQGSVAEITDASGHYTPEAEYTHQAVRQMAAGGVSMQREGHADGMTGPLSTRVKLGGYDHVRGAGKAWIGAHNDAAGADEQMDDGVLNLPYQAFLTAHGNERQMRLKSGLNNQIGGAAQAMAEDRAKRLGVSTEEALGTQQVPLPGAQAPVEPAAPGGAGGAAVYGSPYGAASGNLYGAAHPALYGPANRPANPAAGAYPYAGAGGYPGAAASPAANPYPYAEVSEEASPVPSPTASPYPYAGASGAASPTTSPAAYLSAYDPYHGAFSD